MSSHDAADLMYPLAEALQVNGVEPATRKKIYHALLRELGSRDYHDYPDLFNLDDVLQEAIYEDQGDRWKEYYTIDTSKLKG